MFTKYKAASIAWADLMVASLETRHGTLPSSLKTELIARMQPSTYLYTTFAATKTVCDFLMIFQLAGNSASKPTLNNGAALRWDVDGNITNQNYFPAYTKGTNPGIVTASSTDSLAGVFYLQYDGNNISRIYVPTISGMQYFLFAGNSLAAPPVCTGYPNMIRLEVQSCGLTSVPDVSGFTSGLTSVLLHNNSLPVSQIDKVLSDAVTCGRSNVYLQLNNNGGGTPSAAPSTSGQSNATILRDRGWTVLTN